LIQNTFIDDAAKLCRFTSFDLSPLGAPK